MATVVFWMGRNMGHGSCKRALGMTHLPKYLTGKSRLGATVAVKFSKEFAQSVSWQKVDEKTGAEVADDEDIVDGDGPSVKPMG